MAPASLPRATLALLCFNQEATIREAALACLAQECETLEIILSDDASTDTSWEQLQALAAGYKGPHLVRLRRSERNLGIGAHYNALVQEAQGDLIVTAAGDDISSPERVSTLLAAWDQHNQGPDLITSHLLRLSADGRTGEKIEVDDLGNWQTVEHWLAKRPKVVGAAHAFTKRLHAKFGEFIPGLRYEDQVMTFRALALGGAITITKPLVYYREGGLSSKDASPSLSSMLRRHRNHYYLYVQLKRDLDTLNAIERWPRRFEWRLQRSAAFLSKLDPGFAPETLPNWMQRLASIEATFALRSVKG